MLKSLLRRIWDGGSDPSDSELYGLVAQELANGSMDVGLWTKACAVSDGASERAKATYIEMRVNQLRAARNEIVGAIVTEQQSLQHEARRADAAATQRAALRESNQIHNASIHEEIAALDEKRRPLLAELYGAKSDHQRKRAAAKLLPLDDRRAELLRTLRT